MNFQHKGIIYYNIHWQEHKNEKHKMQYTKKKQSIYKHQCIYDIVHSQKQYYNYYKIKVTPEIVTKCYADTGARKLNNSKGGGQIIKILVPE